MAKLAPDTERLTGSVAPKSKRFKANLGKARFVHQKAKYIKAVIDNVLMYIHSIYKHKDWQEEIGQAVPLLALDLQANYHVSSSRCSVRIATVTILMFVGIRS